MARVNADREVRIARWASCQLFTALAGKKNDDQSAHYIDFWIENSIHAAEQLGNPGGSQNVSELVRRLE